MEIQCIKSTESFATLLNNLFIAEAILGFFQGHTDKTDL